MKKKRIIILTLFLLVLIVAGLAYNYTFNSKHRDIASEEATITLSAKELYAHFESDEALATTNYLDKVIEIQGKITSNEDDEIVLSNQVQVRFNNKTTPIETNGISITIKGRCVGYDELLEMVKIDQATLINKD